MGNTPPPRSQRPRGPSAAFSQGKRNAILEAAREVFLEDGYVAASMDDIAARAQVSKRTVYNHFGSKDTLFTEMVKIIGESISLPLFESEGKDIREVLTALGRGFLATILAPESIEMYRLIVSESVRWPDLGRHFFTAGPDHFQDQIAQYLETQADQGSFQRCDFKTAAEHYAGLILGNTQMRLLTMVGESASEREIDQAVEAGVNAFLQAYGKFPSS